MEMVHVGFGTIKGKDGKPYKTREGDVVGLESLLDEAVARARKVVDENSPELPEAERAAVAEIVGLGAVKYADLSQNRTSDYVFDYDKMLAMDGNTGTYMQYAYARNRSIFRKGEVDSQELRARMPAITLPTPHERALALQLLRLEETLHAAAADYQPSMITAYLWDLAKTYSGFFQNCPVLKAETPALRESRLLLCDLTARVLELCLHLLGIKVVERM
jgi:arginyl-tRNA synthetase